MTWRVLSEIEFDIFTVSNTENTIFDYSLFETTFFFFFSWNRIPYEFWVDNIAKKFKT